MQDGVRRRARSEQAARHDGEPARLGQHRHQRNDVEADKRHCWRRQRSRLIALLTVAAVFGAQVRRGRVQLADHACAVGHSVCCSRCRRRARIRGYAQLREQQRKDRDRDNTHSSKTSNSHGVSEAERTGFDASYKKLVPPPAEFESACGSDCQGADENRQPMLQAHVDSLVISPLRFR